MGLGYDGLLKEGQTVAPDKFDNFTCGRIDLMGDIVTKSAPYLYPFLIEFSLIGAAVLMVMWARIGKNPRYKYHDAIFVIRHRLQDNPFKQLTKSIIQNILDSGVMMTVTEFRLLRGK